AGEISVSRTVIGVLVGRVPGRAQGSAEPDVIRAALVHALGAPDEAAGRLDVRPLTAVHLSGRAGRWNLSVGTLLGSG
ncbi:hypothetical protein ACWCPG_09575, partial [Streptomyces sp. NPDC001919]